MAVNGLLSTQLLQLALFSFLLLNIPGMNSVNLDFAVVLLQPTSVSTVGPVDAIRQTVGFKVAAPSPSGWPSGWQEQPHVSKTFSQELKIFKHTHKIITRIMMV